VDDVNHCWHLKKSAHGQSRTAMCCFCGTEVTQEKTTAPPGHGDKIVLMLQFPELPIEQCPERKEST